MAKRRENHRHSAPRKCQTMREQGLPQSIMAVTCVNSKREGRRMLQHGESRAGNGGPMAEVGEKEEDSKFELQ
jgi:hypothetical protein